MSRRTPVSDSAVAVAVFATAFVKRDGSYGLQRKTIRSRWQAKLREVTTELRRRWHQPIRAQAAYLRSVITGHEALRSTFSATLPRSARLKPVRP